MWTQFTGKEIKQYLNILKEYKRYKGKFIQERYKIRYTEIFFSYQIGIGDTIVTQESQNTYAQFPGQLISFECVMGITTDIDLKA